MQGGIPGQPVVAGKPDRVACLRQHLQGVLVTVFVQHGDEGKAAVEGDGVADLPQQGLLIILLEHGVMGAADGLQGPGVLLQPLLLLFFLGDVVEEDADPDHLAQLVVQRKLGGAEPAGLAPLQIGFFMALDGAAGHDLQIVIPIALGQFGREEVGIALADQLGRGEGEIACQQPVAGDEDGAGVFEQHPIGQLIHHLAKQGGRGLRGKGRCGS